MKLQLIVSSLNREMDELISSMNIKSDAVIINQSSSNEYKEKECNFGKIKFYQFNERGVGLSRNNGLLRATGDIILFSDEDITYDDDYVTKVLNEFEKHKDADMLLFNMKVCQERATYHTEKLTRIKWYNSGRYPTYSFAVKREKLHKSGVCFSLLFGGGALYSAGEDSLFLKNLIDKKFKIYAVPVSIGQEAQRESSWFRGYTEKFFFDRGVLFHFLYGKLAYLMGIRYVITKKSFACREVEPKRALALIKAGIKEAKR